jgi:hypothetical protein
MAGSQTSEGLRNAADRQVRVGDTEIARGARQNPQVSDSLAYHASLRLGCAVTALLAGGSLLR